VVDASAAEPGLRDDERLTLAASSAEFGTRTLS
jgi:hypothetical protein